jgi:HTH-type transcriptional regulator, sugar sensing transcriptional regulator
MSEISNNLIESLKTMGLTEYEAKVYSALVLFNRAEVKQIYEYLNIPKPSTYQSLKTLMNQGLVQVVSSKPAIYKATLPKIALRHLSEAHKNAEESALEALEHLETIRVDTESEDILWTLFGENNVEHSMEEMMCKAQKSMKLILPPDSLEFLSFAKKDLEIELLIFGKDSSLAKHYGLTNLTVHDAMEIDTSDFGKIPRYFMNLSLPPEQYSKFILVYIDDNEFMYIPPFPGTTQSGITSKNPYTVAMVGIIFGAVWEHTADVPLE